MLDILGHRTYRQLFAAQVIALLGTGLATVALGLLAFDLAGDDAGVVLGTALAIKMAAYVGVAPVAAAFVNSFPRRAVLVSLDLVRAARRERPATRASLCGGDHLPRWPGRGG